MEFPDEKKAGSCSRGGTTGAAEGKLYFEKGMSDKLLREDYSSGCVMTSLERNRSMSAKMSCGGAQDPVPLGMRRIVFAQVIGAGEGAVKGGATDRW